MVSATDRQELLKYLVAPAGEGWQWAATWTRTEADGESHSIEFYRTIPPAKTPEERVADLLIAKGPDMPAAYRAIAAEIVAMLKKEGKQ